MNDQKNGSILGRQGSRGGARLDLRGLRCPLPVLKIRKALLGLDPGAVLTASADDPLAGLDVQNLVRETGDELLSAEHDGSAVVFRIRRTKRDDAGR